MQTTETTTGNRIKVQSISGRFRRRRGPIDIAVDVGLVPPELPPIFSGRELLADPPPAPPEILSGILHQGCKMILAGNSKSNKSWCLLELALSAATGQSWWERPTERCQVLYLNLELPDWALLRRVTAIADARPELKDYPDCFHAWNLRGHCADLSRLRPDLEYRLELYDFGLIILDPAYKVLGDRDENANGDITSLMNELELLATKTGAAIVVAHHFAKGDSSSKEPIDRLSGAGAWGRDPDSLLVLTPHEEPGCFSVNTILRNLPRLPEFVLQWDYPLMRVAHDLDPASIRTAKSERKLATDREFVEWFLTTTPQSRQAILAKTGAAGFSRTSADRYLGRLAKAGLIGSGNGLYWRPDHE